MSKPSVTLILAATQQGGIGYRNALPWRLPTEMAYFKNVTTSSGGAPTAPTTGEGEAEEEEGMNAVIMGRKTWEGIPRKFKPLQGRVNVVVTRQENYDVKGAPHTFVVPSLSAGIALCADLPLLASSHLHPHRRRIFLIGGSQLYSQSLSLPFPDPSFLIDRILLTRVQEPEFECDAFVEGLPREGSEGWKKASWEETKEWTGQEGEEERREMGIRFEFQMWTRS